MWDMIVKSRYEPEELKLWRCLHLRMDLSDKDASYYSYLEKGYKGETKFDEWLGGLSDNCLILNDILLEINNTHFQIDSILLCNGTCYLFEVKNYEGDYYVENDRWYSLSKNEIKNPLLQLQRSESLLRRFLQDLGYNLSVESFVIFVNPNFTLYQSPLNKPIIFPTQLTSFLNKLNRKISSSRLNGKHAKLAQQILVAHKHESPYSLLPDYSYDQLKKGVTCASCHSLLTVFEGKSLICKCGCVEFVDTAVLRSVEEFKRLFPKQKLTVSTIYEWCGGFTSKKVIRKILARNYKLVKKARASFYINSD
jgi:hypothetical protein